MSVICLGRDPGISAGAQQSVHGQCLDHRSRLHTTEVVVMYMTVFCVLCPGLETKCRLPTVYDRRQLHGPEAENSIQHTKPSGEANEA
jgi:hypothetical protein